MKSVSDAIKNQNDSFKFFKWFIGAFRLMHFLPVITVTIIGITLTFVTLKGENTLSEFFMNIKLGIIPIEPIVLLILTIFFQEAFCGIQNDYLDKEVDGIYKKSKAITDGWVSDSFAFWWAILCFVAFTALSVALSFWSLIGFWTILLVQGANLIGIFYNIYAKNKPISIIPYMIGFPMIPLFVWTTFSGFKVDYLWLIPVLILVSFPAHIPNELPDFDYDIKFQKKNFTVFVGKRTSILLNWISILLIYIEIMILFFFYSINLWLFIGITIGTFLTGIAAFILQWKKNWEIDLLVFNIITLCIGIEVIGFILALTYF